eukprot:8360799-Pyramimonas_sp.AAC.2
MAAQVADRAPPRSAAVGARRRSERSDLRRAGSASRRRAGDAHGQDAPAGTAGQAAGALAH